MESVRERAMSVLRAWPCTGGRKVTVEVEKCARKLRFISDDIYSP